MNFLFSKKIEINPSKNEGLVISRNRNRAYIKAKSLNFLSSQQKISLISSCEEKFPLFKSSIYIEISNNENFIVIEPLVTGKINKEKAMELADTVTEYLKTLV